MVTVTAGMEDMDTVDMDTEDMDTEHMNTWIMWYWNCLRAKKAQNISTCDVKILEKWFVLCGLFNDVASTESYIHSLERTGV